MQERKKRALLLFSLIFAFFFVLVAYLLLMSPGLKFEIIEKKLYLKNESSHVIHDVQVRTEDGTIIDCIDALKPGELVRIILPPEKKSALVVASAPFHREIKQEVSFENKEMSPLKLSTSHEDATINGKFKVFLEVCNNSSEDSYIKVAESHERSFLKEENKTIIVNVKAGACKKIPFEFTALQRGTTFVTFNISGELFKESISEEIVIE